MFRFGDPGGRIYTSAGTSNANMLSHWTAVSTGSNISVSASNGRVTGSCIRFASMSFTAAGLLKTLDSQQTWGLAFAFRAAGSPTSGPYSIATFWDVTAVQVDLRLNQDMTLSAYRGTTILGTTSVALSINTWNHIEIKVKIDPSVGTVEVRINGVAKLTLTSQNTRTSANSTANAISIGAYTGSTTNSVSNGTWDFDDIIIWDTAATDANGFTDINNFIGDTGLTWLLPTGAGTTTQFTPDTGSNYARINEATPDGDTSYVEDSTVGHIDTYACADLAAGATSVLTVASIIYAKKTDVGPRGIKSELRCNSGNTAHTTEIALGNSYQYNFQNWGQNPNNGSATNWTPTNVNSAEIGQTVSS